MAGAASPRSRRSKTLLLTDIQGSTRLWEHNPEVMGAAVARHDAIVRAATEGAGGLLVREKGEGDSTFSVFDDAAAALHAAVALQRAIAAEPWLTKEPIVVRAGIHTGEVEPREGDFYGGAVNRAARIREIAAGSSIVLSAATLAAAKERLPPDTWLVDLGTHRLRGLVGVEQVYALAHVELLDPEVLLDDLRHRAAPPVPATLRVHGDAELIGRDRELTELRDAWSTVRTRGAVFALVAGEPGVGKTRLVAELADHAAARGALVLFGRCDEEPLRPYQPFAEALGCALDRLTHDELVEAVGDAAAELVLLRPELRSRVAVVGEPTGERYALFDAIASFLARLALARPTLVVLDDLHWADEPSLALLRHTLQVNGATPIMFVGTYRDTDVAAESSLVQSLVSLRREIPTVELVVRGLGRDDVAALLGTAHGDALDDVWSVSDGNPFFVVELRRELGRPSPRGVPQSVRQSVVERVRQLPTPARGFLRAAAVTGVVVDVSVAASAADVDPDAAGPAVVRGVLQELDTPNRLRFSHALVRAAVLDDMSRVDRAALHRRVAIAIEALHGDRLDQQGARLAHHYREAGELGAQGPAFVWSMRAGRYAGSLLAYEEAAGHFRVAASIAEDAHDARGRITAELEQGEVLRRSGRPASGLALAAAAESAASEVGASDLAAWAVFTTRFGQALGASGNLDAIRRARSNLGADSPWQGPLDVVGAGELIQSGEVDAGIELLTATRDRARTAGNGVVLALALTGSHMFVDRLAVTVDDILAALATADEAMAPSVRLSPRVLRVQTESLRIGQLVAAGDVAAARRSATDFTERYGDETGTLEANVPLFAMTDALLSGEWSAWRLRTAAFRDDAELASAYAPQLLASELMSAWVRGTSGQLAPAIEPLPHDLMFVRPGLALALANGGRGDDAHRVIAECASGDGFTRRARTVSGRVELALLGYAAARVGDVDAARRLYELLLPRRGQVAAWAGWAFWGAFDAVLGVLAACCGNPRDAVAHLEVARTFHDRAGWRALTVMTTADLVGALLERGDPGDVAAATRLAHEANDLAHELGLTGVADRLTRLGPAGARGGPTSA